MKIIENTQKINKDFKNKCGVYKITISDKVYIGSSVNIYDRLRGHLHHLKTNRHTNPYLQNLFNKYKTCTFDIIEECSESERLIREEFYIQELNAEINIIIKPTEFNLSELTSKKCYYYTLNGEYCGEFNSLNSAGRYFNTTGACVYQSIVTNGRCQEYLFSYEKLNKLEKYIPQSIIIYKVNLDGNIISTFKSMYECCKIENIKSKDMNEAIRLRGCIFRNMHFYIKDINNYVDIIRNSSWNPIYAINYITGSIDYYDSYKQLIITFSNGKDSLRYYMDKNKLFNNTFYFKSFKKYKKWIN